MTRFYYFKITFIAVATGLTTGLFVYNGLTIENFTMPIVGTAVAKSLFTGICTALILALLNMIFRITPFKNK